MSGHLSQEVRIPTADLQYSVVPSGAMGNEFRIHGARQTRKETHLGWSTSNPVAVHHAVPVRVGVGN